MFGESLAGPNGLLKKIICASQQPYPFSSLAKKRGDHAPAAAVLQLPSLQPFTAPEKGTSEALKIDSKKNKNSKTNFHPRGKQIAFLDGFLGSFFLKDEAVIST